MKANKIIISFFIIFAFFGTTVFSAPVDGNFSGIENSKEIIKNINFKDITAPGYWAKDAIYKMSGLSIIKGYGDNTYKPSKNITKAEALALIYRAIGKEADAIKEGQKINAERSDEERQNDALSVWADGYLSLAKNDGLITQDEYDQAVNLQSQDDEKKIGFDANVPATRQEVGVWLSKAFKIEPIYTPNDVFNNFSDWKQINQENIPYIEGLLKEKIMNGDNGRFYPENYIRRDEMAQVLENAISYILKANNLTQKNGYIESISYSQENQTGLSKGTKIIAVRGSDGSNINIILSSEENNLDAKSTESGQHDSINSTNEVVVNRNGILGNSTLLNKDDEVVLIFDNDKKIKFIKAKPADKSKKVYFGTVQAIDASNKLSINTENTQKTFPVSQNAVITINSEGKTLAEVPFGANAYFTVNHNIIEIIEVTNTKKDGTEWYFRGEEARGIVGEISSTLNYISLYSLDGMKDPKFLRTFNFNPKVSVNKDGVKSSVSSIEAGDTVYIRFNGNYAIDLINVESNYIAMYGNVLSKGIDSLILKKEDQTSVNLHFDNNTIVIKDDKLCTINDLKAGDKVKLTVSQTDKYSNIKGIKIEEINEIDKLYKGKFYEINKDSISINGLRTFSKGKWVLASNRGIVNLKLGENVKLYADNKLLDIENAKDNYQDKYVYITTYKDYGQNENVIMVTSLDGFEKLYNNKVSQVPGDKSIKLENSNDKIKYGEGTIVSKYGSLTNGQNIKVKDPVYIVGVRDPYSGDIMAGIIEVVDKPSIMGVDIYRGKITSIDEGKSFTVESFSILKGLNWEFVNTPKTFDISTQTRIIGSSGVINNRDFIDYTTASYKDKIVYIACIGTEAQVITDVAYGIVNVRGEIYKTTQASSTTASIVKLDLKDSVVYNSTTSKWDALDGATVNACANSIIIKEEKIVEPEDLAIGDKIRVIKKDNTAAGDGFIILVEE